MARWRPHLERAGVDIWPLRDVEDVMAEAVRAAPARLQDAAARQRPQAAQHAEQTRLACATSMLILSVLVKQIFRVEQLSPSRTEPSAGAGMIRGIFTVDLL